MILPHQTNCQSLGSGYKWSPLYWNELFVYWNENKNAESVGLSFAEEKIKILIASHIFTEGKNTSSNGSVDDSNCVTVPRRIISLIKSILITQLDNINDAPSFLFELNTWVYEVSGIDIYEVETSQLTQDDYNCPDHAVEWPPVGDRKILRRMKGKMSLSRWHLLCCWYSKKNEGEHCPLQKTNPLKDGYI